MGVARDMILNPRSVGGGFIYTYRLIGGGEKLEFVHKVGLTLKVLMSWGVCQMSSCYFLYVGWFIFFNLKMDAKISNWILLFLIFSVYFILYAKHIEELSYVFFVCFTADSISYFHPLKLAMGIDKILMITTLLSILLINAIFDSCGFYVWKKK